MRAACYCGTRNVYEEMLTSAKSLLLHSNVEKIYFLIEDDEFPVQLPPCIECINVSNQTFFKPDGPNFNSRWTYMTLMRVALTKILPKTLDKVLSIDIDTIVVNDVSRLWEKNFDDYYFMAVKEIKLSKPERPYINFGVHMQNLKKMREDGIDDILIEALNTKEYRFKEQDCVNELCQDKIKLMSGRYNASEWITGVHPGFCIRHFAAIPAKTFTTYPLYQEYKNIPLKRVWR